MSRTLPTAALLAILLGTAPAQAQMTAAPNLNGTPGLIDMPSSDTFRDGWLGVTHGQFGPISRNSLSYQITPRLSGSFRYVGIKDWNDRFCPPDCSGANAFDTYFDRNFDLRYRILNEGKYLPAVTIGLQDFVGTGLSMAEYVVATKSIGPRLRVTAGLGFGRLGSYGALGSPFGDRPKVDFGNGGLVNSAQWFRGPAAPFGGIEYQFADNWRFKAEYSSDAYAQEGDLRGTFERAARSTLGWNTSAASRYALASTRFTAPRSAWPSTWCLTPSSAPLPVFLARPRWLSAPARRGPPTPMPMMAAG